MYTSSYDRAGALLVAHLTKPDAGAADFEQQMQAMRRLDEDAAGKQVPGYILLIDPNYPQLDASTRKRIASEWGSLRGPSFAVAFVSSSIVHRGVMTAISWLIPQNRARLLSAHNDFDGAVQWLESVRGQWLDVLHVLMRDVRVQASATPQAVSRNAPAT